MIARVPLSYTPIDAEAIYKLLQSYNGQPHENIINDFERKLSEFSNSKYVVALNSGTAAIHLSLKAIGVEANDEVLVSTFTYVATVNPILYLNAKPIFIDVDKSSWNMDPVLLEVAIRDRLSKGIKPKAILVVHTYGMPADMVEIMNISFRYQIPVVEDAAEALGSKIDNRYVGTFGKIGVISFNNNKILTTYGGGAIFTANEEIADKILFWAGQSRESKLYYEHREIGYNYRMGSMNAAVGLSKIDQLEMELAERRTIFQNYEIQLSPKGFIFQNQKHNHFSNCWLSTIYIKKEDLMHAISNGLYSMGIETRRAWNPMHLQPVFEGSPFYGTDTSEDLFNHVLCLPSGANLGTSVQSRVMTAIIDFLGR
jgi:dTDP-4-amino-4,6-dideoxygalactose transaminase